MASSRVPLLVAAMVVLVGAALVWMLTGPGSDDAPEPGPSEPGDADQLRLLVERFNAAAQFRPEDAVAMLCAEEREAAQRELLTGFPDARTGDPSPVTVGEVVVRNGVASAQVTPANGLVATLYFRREQGAWTVCAPAQADFDQSEGDGP